MSKVEYWIDLAKYDLETARAMNDSKNLTLLAQKSAIYNEMTDEQKDFLDFLEP